MIKDLDELVLSCRSSLAKEYIREAVKCYQTGAYKACIISTWAALVYDIVDKIKELSLTGDAQAIQLLEKFKTYKDQIEHGNSNGIKSALEFERGILDIAKDELEFIDKSQYDDLIRLKEDRHKCAHPSFRKDDSPYNPSAELARLHIRNTVEYILSQPPVQGKAAFNYIAESINSEYFPNEHNKILAELSHSSFVHSTYALKIMLVDKLFFDFFEPRTFSTKTMQQKVAILNACYDIAPNVVSDRLIHHLNSRFDKTKDEQFYIYAWLISRLKFKTWDNLNDILRERVKNLILHGNKIQVLTTLPELADIKDLKSIIHTNFVPSLSIDNLTEAFTKGRFNLKKFLYPVVINRYINNYNNPVILNTIARNLLLPHDYLMDDASANEILRLYSKHPYEIRDSASLDSVIRILYNQSAGISSQISKIEIDTVLIGMGKENLIMSNDDYQELTIDIPF